MYKRKERIDAEWVEEKMPWQRLEEHIKMKIAKEVLERKISLRGACKKYKISRPAITQWVEKLRVDRIILSSNQTPKKL